MKIFGLVGTSMPVAGLAAFALLASMGGCAQEKPAPVGTVLEYDPANDPSVSAMEDYMKQGETAGMEVEERARP